ncbi:hypothetical protein Tco_0024618 [Tanacetum coccineum]
MLTLHFVDTHNMVAFLEKPNESAGFEQIIDFLNASSIVGNYRFDETKEQKNETKGSKSSLKNTTSYALTVNPTIYVSCIKQLWATTKVKTVNEIVHIQALVDKKKVIITETSVKSDIQLEDVEGTDCLPTATIFEELTRMGLGKDFYGRDTPLFLTMLVQAQEEVASKKQKSRKSKKKNTKVPQPSDSTADVPNDNVTTTSNDPLLSGEDRLQLNELMNLCTILQSRVLALETTKTTQALEIENLKRRVKKLEKKQRSRTHKLKRLYKVGATRRVESSDDEEVTLINETEGRYEQDVIKKEVSTADPVTTAGEVVTTASITLEEINLAQESILAQELAAMKSAKPKEKVVVQETSVPVSAATSMVSTATTIVVATPIITTQPQQRAKGIAFREPVESTVTTIVPSQKSSSKDKGNAIMTEPEVPLKKKDQLRIDEELVRQLEAGEQEAAMLEREEAEKLEQANLALLREALQQESVKKQKVDEEEGEMDDDQEKAQMKRHMEIVMPEDIAINAISLATKPPCIHMNARPEESYERVLWGDLKVMFEPDVKSKVWRNLQGHNVTVWKLFDSCGVYFVRFQNLHIFMLVEKRINDAHTKLMQLERLQLLEELMLLPKKWLGFCQSLRNTNHVKDFELASLLGKLKYEENLIDSIYETKKPLVSATPLSTAFFSTSIVQDFQDSPDDEEDTRNSQEYMNDLEEEYQARVFLAKSKRFFKRALKDSSLQKQLIKLNVTNVAKLAILSSNASASKSSMVKNKGLIAEAYEWDKEEVSSDDNEMVKVKVLMALAEDENTVVGQDSARNREWVKIAIRKVHTLLDMENNDERKSFLDYLSIDLNYVEEQRNDLVLC